MAFIWIVVAFAFGFAARQLGVPPLVGYLSAGFVLHAYGLEPDAALQPLADLGITLMLFTIGLKINIKELMRADIWGAALGHMSLWMILLIPLVSLCAIYSSAYYFELDLMATAIVAFALSFSSTVCVIKVLEDNSELKSRHSDLAIGVLIVQDLIAVLFLIIATGKTPSPWAIGLFALIPMRVVAKRVFDYSGHGELLPLLGIFLAVGGSVLFESVDVKGDLGALAVGMLLAGIPKANEMYKSLSSFKDIFLIAFFLSIGFTALPSAEMWAFALLIALALPFKLLMFFWIFTRFSFRARTAFLSSLLLANFSEFGLIVASLSVDVGWLPSEWLVIIALAMSMSFVFSTLIYKFSHVLYVAKKPLIQRFQRSTSVEKCIYTQPDGAEILVIGMGRVGLGAYEDLVGDYGNAVCGIDFDQERVANFQANGKHVIFGDADDIEFWESIDLEHVRLIMLAVPSVTEMKNILFQLQSADYHGKVATIARYDDERKDLLELGADVAFNYYAEVGTGFAEESRRLL